MSEKDELKDILKRLDSMAEPAIKDEKTKAKQEFTKRMTLSDKDFEAYLNDEPIPWASSSLVSPKGTKKND